MIEYYLLDVNKIQRIPCDYEIRILEAHDFSNLYKPEWSNALCEERKELDVLGVGAYDRYKLICLVGGCSAWSNIRSVRNAIKSGFIPAWVEMTVKPQEIVAEMIK